MKTLILSLLIVLSFACSKSLQTVEKQDMVVQFGFNADEPVNYFKLYRTEGNISQEVLTIFPKENVWDYSASFEVPAGKRYEYTLVAFHANGQKTFSPVVFY